MALHIDFETRSVADLREVGLYNYAHHPTTAPWCLAYAFDEAEPSLWLPGDPCPAAIRRHVESGGQVIAHNVQFEFAIWNTIMAPRFGWPELKLEQVDCTMARAYAMGLPGALEDAALTLGLSVLKDTEGRALMLRLARPRSAPGETPVVWWDDPPKLARLYEYCKQDVRVEQQLHARLLPLSAKERQVWLLDQKINLRGVQVDVVTAAAAAHMAETVRGLYDRQIEQLTDGKVKTCNAVAALKQWIAEQGVEVDSLARQAIVDMEAAVGHDLPQKVRAALRLRQEAAKASAAKYSRIKAMSGPDQRLRYIYQYHGAATGRWAGRAVQVHNLVRDTPAPRLVEQVIDLVRAGDHETIDAVMGPPMSVLGRCSRAMFVAPPGFRLIAGDFANIEGRGQAWFAGEDWKLDVFRAADAGRGPGVYETAYAKMFGVPVESVKDPSPERQIGKVCELAFGYQGGVGAFHVMAQTMGLKVSDRKAEELKQAWRAAHPRIVAVWRDIESAARAALLQPGQAFSCGAPGRQATYKKVGSFLWCQLPSGRVICYPYPKLLADADGSQITYMTAPSPNSRRSQKVIDDPSNSNVFVRVVTYGGALFNNIVQGFCRDVLADLLLRLDKRGARIVLHTHDEAVIEVEETKAERAREEMQKMMRTPPVWAPDLPVFAKCTSKLRYGK